jgi:hypothetical protein
MVQTDRRTQDDLIRFFVIDSKKKRKRLMDGLLRCASAEDQMPAEKLRSAIDSISSTIASIRSGTKTFADLKRFHLSVSLPVSAEQETAELTMEITQRPQSHPLPPHHYIEIKPPVGLPVQTPPIRSRSGPAFSYWQTFDLGSRSGRQMELLRAKDIEFRIFRKSIAVARAAPRPVLVGLATAPLAPLSFALNSTAPLNFIGMDGKRTNFLFDVRMSVLAPLVPQSDIAIDETIDVIQE